MRVGECGPRARTGVERHALAERDADQPSTAPPVSISIAGNMNGSPPIEAAGGAPSPAERPADRRADDHHEWSARPRATATHQHDDETKPIGVTATRAASLLAAGNHRAQHADPDRHIAQTPRRRPMRSTAARSTPAVAAEKQPARRSATRAASRAPWETRRRAASRSPASRGRDHERMLANRAWHLDDGELHHQVRRAPDHVHSSERESETYIHSGLRCERRRRCHHGRHAGAF